MKSLSLLSPLILLWFGCSDNHSSDPTYIQANAEYDLAKQKSDLDGIYLSLSKLKSMNALSSEQEEDFDKVSKAMPLIEQIRRSISDHDHESVVLNASKFLKFYPKNAEVRKLFTESSNIFNALELALSKLREAFPNGELLSKTDENGTSETDLPKISNLIIDASSHAQRAKTLDPNFVKTKEIAKNLEGTRRFMSLMLARKIYNLTSISLMLSDRSARQVYNGMIEIRNINPSGFDLQKTWNVFSGNMASSKERMESLIAMTEDNLNMMRDLSNESNLYKSIKRLNSETIDMLELLLDPTGGNLSDWSRDIDKASLLFKKVTNEIDTNIPNDERAMEDILAFALLWSNLEIYNNSETIKILGNSL